MDVRWLLDVGFQAFFRILVAVTSDMNVIMVGAQNLSFGRPGAPTLAPWGTIGRSRNSWEHKKRDLGVQAWILLI